MLFISEKLIQYHHHPPLYKIYKFVHLILCGGKNDRNCNYLPNLTITMINIFFCLFAYLLIMTKFITKSPYLIVI